MRSITQYYILLHNGGQSARERLSPAAPERLKYAYDTCKPFPLASSLAADRRPRRRAGDRARRVRLRLAVQRPALDQPASGGHDPALHPHLRPQRGAALRNPRQFADRRAQHRPPADQHPARLPASRDQHRGRQLLQQSGHRPGGHFARAVDRPARRRGDRGRQHHHPAGGAQSAARPRAARRANRAAQAARDDPRRPTARRVQQGRHPRAVPEPVLFRQPRLRHRGGGASLLWQVRARFVAGGMRAARRAAAIARHLRSADQPDSRDQPSGGCARPDGDRTASSRRRRRTPPSTISFSSPPAPSRFKRRIL